MGRFSCAACNVHIATNYLEWVASSIYSPGYGNGRAGAAIPEKRIIQARQSFRIIVIPPKEENFQATPSFFQWPSGQTSSEAEDEEDYAMRDKDNVGGIQNVGTK